MQILMLIVDFGFNLTATKEIAIHSNNSNKISEVYWGVTFLKFIIACIVFIITTCFFYSYAPFGEYKLAVFIASLSIFGVVFFPIWLFQGLRELKVMAILSSISKLVFLPLIFVFVKESSDLLIAVLIHSLVHLSSGVVALIYLYFGKISVGKLKRSFLSRNSLIFYIKDSYSIFLSNSAISLYTSGIMVILGFFVSSQLVGVYGAIDRIVRVVCFGVYGPISQASFPIVVKTKITSLDKARAMMRYILIGTFVLMVFILGCFFAVEDFLLINYFPELLNYKTLLIVSMFSIIPISLGGVCGQLGLVGLGGVYEKKIFTKVYIYVGVLSLFVSFFSIKYWSIEGAVYSVILSEICVFLLMLYFSIKSKLLW